MHFRIMAMILASMSCMAVAQGDNIRTEELHTVSVPTTQHQDDKRDGSRFYLGAKAGSYLNDDNEDFSETALGGYGGYRVNQYIAAEAEYLNLSEDSEYSSDFEGDLYVVSLRPSLPLGDNWEIFGKIGWYWLDGDLTENYNRDQPIELSADDDGLFLGVGVTWYLNGFHIRSEYQSDEQGAFGGLAIFSLSVGIDF